MEHRDLPTLYIQCHDYPSWWRHQMETFSALLAICAGSSPVPGEFPTQRPVTRSFDDFFDLRLNKRLSKQSWGWWLETLSRPLWRHRNDAFGTPGAETIAAMLLTYFSWNIQVMASKGWQLVISGCHMISMVYLVPLHRSVYSTVLFLYVKCKHTVVSSFLLLSESCILHSILWSSVWFLTNLYQMHHQPLSY